MKISYFISEIFKKFPLLLSVNVMLLVMVGLLDAVSIFSLAPIIDFMIHPDMQGASSVTLKIVGQMKRLGLKITLLNLLFIFVLINFLRSGFYIFAYHSILRTKYAVLRDVMLGTFEDFFQARWAFFCNTNKGTLLNTFLREIVVVGDAFGAMARLFAVIIQSALYLTVPFFFSWQVTSISLALCVLLSMPFVLFGRISYRLGKLNTETANQTSKVIEESLGLAKVILGFGNQLKSLEALGQAFDAHQRATLKSQTLMIAIPNLFLPLGLIVLAITIFIAKWLNLALSATVIILYSLYKAIPSLGQLSEQKTSLNNFFASYEQIMGLRKRAKQLKQKTGTRVFQGLQQEIRFEGVLFAYNGHEPVLRDINLVIPKGRMIAIVGESGVGKSTLIDMIMGFNEPSTGRITIDGIPLPEFDVEIYRHRIGYVPQESILFNLTVKDNLLWARKDASDQEVKIACGQANAAEFINDLPKGYDTLVGDRGVLLSVGQCQRLALARAILRQPDLLVLDEATSSLDTHSERLIQQAIESIARDTTVIVIAHRLSTIVNADYIYVLNRGSIAEEGTYVNLIRQNGIFKQMAQLQTLDSSSTAILR